MIADKPMAIAASVCMAVLGIAFFLGMPIMVGLWSELAGFSAQQAGWLATADTSGLVAASLLVAQVVTKLNRRKLVLTGIMIAIAANLAALSNPTFTALLAMRFAAGLGSGVLYAVGLAVLASTSQTGRNYSILLFSQVCMGILMIHTLPLAAGLVGMSGTYLVMCGIFLLALLLLPWLPAHVVPVTDTATEFDNHSTEHPRSRVPASLPWMCLVAFFTFYLTIGSFWAYIERIGNNAGLESAFIETTLSYTQIISLFSCILAAWLSKRIGQLRPLIFSLLVGAAAIFFLSMGVTEPGFVLVLVMFFLVWNPIDIYQLGTLSTIDHSGKYVAMVPAFQGSANALGPGVGALLLSVNNNYDSVLILGACFMLLSAIIYIYIFTRLRRIPVTSPDIEVANTPELNHCL